MPIIKTNAIDQLYQQLATLVDAGTISEDQTTEIKSNLKAIVDLKNDRNNALASVVIQKKIDRIRAILATVESNEDHYSKTKNVFVNGLILVGFSGLLIIAMLVFQILIE